MLQERESGTETVNMRMITTVKSLSLMQCIMPQYIHVAFSGCCKVTFLLVLNMKRHLLKKSSISFEETQYI